MQRSFLTLSVFTLLLAFSAHAEGIVQSPAYQECSKLAVTDPVKALAKANEWLRIDDGIPPHHCRAMALFGLQRFEQSADALELIRDKAPTNDITLQSYLTHQAAKSWVSAGKVEAALGSIARQLDLMGKVKNDNVTAAQLSAELLIDRAEIRSNYGQLKEAARDLDHAISLTPLNVDALLARADIFARLGDVGLANADAQSVLRLEPANEKARVLLTKINNK
jgi:tetratricopeptide (TPR) repeat protein